MRTYSLSPACTGFLTMPITLDPLASLREVKAPNMCGMRADLVWAEALSGATLGIVSEPGLPAQVQSPAFLRHRLPLPWYVAGYWKSGRQLALAVPRVPLTRADMGPPAHHALDSWGLRRCAMCFRVSSSTP